MGVLDGAEFEHLMHGESLGFQVPGFETGVDVEHPVVDGEILELGDVLLQVEDAVDFCFEAAVEVNVVCR